MLLELARNFSFPSARPLNDILERLTSSVIVRQKCPCYIQFRDPKIRWKIDIR
jgi:hypothetical protein